MIKATVKVDGMMCPMCEAHANDAIRNAMQVKSVESSHKAGETVIIAETIDQEAVRTAIEKTGYKVLGIETEKYEKKSFLGKLFGR
jgi:copper chaperone CopZ